MEEVKKKKLKKVKMVEEEAEKVEEVEETEKEEVKAGEEPKEDKKPKEGEKPKKKGLKKLLVGLAVLVVLGGAGLAAKMFLTKTTVAVETVKLPDEARGFSNYFKEYLLNRVRAEKLFGYSFRNMTNEEILAELAELKDGFSKVSRGVAGSYKNSDYEEVAEVMASDSALYLTAVRELRTVMTDNYGEEGDRQLAFMRKVEETTEGLRSALYMARAAFGEDVSALSAKGVILFEGAAMVEVGGGVMNILVGDLATPVTAVTTDDMGGIVKLIEAQKLFGYAGTRLFEIDEGLGAMLEGGWVKDVKAEVGSSEVKLTTKKVSLVMKNVWGADEELRGEGIKGLVNTEKVAMEEQLNEVVKGLKGAK